MQIHTTNQTKTRQFLVFLFTIQILYLRDIIK
ncbi:hypothetical protein Alsa3_CDS0054 [Staphylococcus phage Alsa_3]|nr:hypothetical protein Alsa3_CDS0054 [Staphylococcus phage Alsa_3]WNM51176.1 hypothetical protein Alsa4_CDS0046 [Staphylococcus phage Alsa_4]